MLLGWVATVAAFLAVLSGLSAVGTGHRWHYALPDLIRLRLDALLYAGVILTTIWSLCHTLILLIWTTGAHASSVPALVPFWMALHIAIAVFLIALHVYVTLTLRDPLIVTCLQRHAWGSRG